VKAVAETVKEDGQCFDNDQVQHGIQPISWAILNDDAGKICSPLRVPCKG